MTLLILGLLLFLGVHSVSIFNAPWRDRMHARFGEAGWKGVYSLVSLAGFAVPRGSSLEIKHFSALLRQQQGFRLDRATVGRHSRTQPLPEPA